jgi:hypothetical protein
MSTPEILLNQIAKIIADPYPPEESHIEAQEKAMKILLKFHSYIGEHEHCQEDTYPHCWVDIDDNFRFWYFLVKKFGQEYVNKIDDVMKF